MPTGASLGGLVFLWLAGRILVRMGPVPLGAIVDALFLPTLAVVVALPIWRAKKVRSFVVVAILALLAFANGLFHLAHLGVIPVRFESLATLVALDVIVFLMIAIGGRLIPTFIANALPQARPRRVRSVELLSIGSMILILLADVLGAWVMVPTTLEAGLLSVAVLAQVLRLWLWNPLVTRREALLWVLPLSYAWIPVVFALRAAGPMIEGISGALWIHALGIGAMSGLMLAMMSRSALGHSGRALSAGAVETVVFFLIQAAAVSRVAVPLIWPPGYRASLYVAASCWTLAFAVFHWRYVAVLLGPRIDERQV